MKRSIFAAVVIFAGILLGDWCFVYFSSETLNAKIVKTEALNEGRTKYMVWTDREIFVHKTCYIEMVIDPAELYGQLEPGKTYELTVYGYRNKWMKSYRNIIGVKHEE